MNIFSGPITFNGDTNIFNGPIVAVAKNNTARLITVNVMDEETGNQLAFQFLPGDRPATPIPAKVANLAFFKSLVERSELSVFQAE